MNDTTVKLVSLVNQHNQNLKKILISHIQSYCDKPNLRSKDVMESIREQMQNKQGVTESQWIYLKKFLTLDIRIPEADLDRVFRDFVR